MTLEMGKTLTDANAEVTYASEFFRVRRRGGRGRRRASPVPVRWQSILTYRQPIGVALLVTPWNFPAPWPPQDRPCPRGRCTVVVKPAGETPLTTLYIASLMERSASRPVSST